MMKRFGVLGLSLWCLTIGAMESTNEPVRIAASIKAVLAIAQKKFQACEKQEQDGARLRTLIDDAVSTTIKDKYPVSLVHMMIVKELGDEQPIQTITCDKKVRAIDINTAGTHILAGVDNQVRLFAKLNGKWRVDEFNSVQHASPVTAVYFGESNRFVSTNEKGYVCVYMYDDWDIKQETAFKLPDTKVANIITINDAGDRVAAACLDEDKILVYKRTVAHWDLSDEFPLFPMKAAGMQWTTKGTLLAYGLSLKNLKNHGIIANFTSQQGVWFPTHQEFEKDRLLGVLTAHGCTGRHQDADSAFSMISGTYVSICEKDITIEGADSYISCTDAIAQRGWE